MLPTVGCFFNSGEHYLCLNFHFMIFALAERKNNSPQILFDEIREFQHRIFRALQSARLHIHEAESEYLPVHLLK